MFVYILMKRYKQIQFYKTALAGDRKTSEGCRQKDNLRWATIALLKDLRRRSTIASLKRPHRRSTIYIT